MSITDAEFTAWLRSDLPRRVLCEVDYAYESGGALAESRVYLSDGPYTTGPADTPPNIAYRAVIEKAPEFERRIDVNTLGGRGLVSVSSMQVYAVDGLSDFLFDLICDGREARYYLGSPDWPRADFRLVFVALVGRVKSNGEKTIVVELRDKSYLLDATIVGDAIATGPNAGRPKPILLGRVKNFDAVPYLLDSADLTYYVNNFALDTSFGGSVFATVRDAGVDLLTADLMFMDSGNTTADAGTDTITYVGHGLSANDVVLLRHTGTPFAGLSKGVQYWVIAAGLTADDFRLSLTKGGSAVDITGTVITGSVHVDRRRFYCDASNATIELSGTPAGRVTLDHFFVDAGGFFDTAVRPHTVFQWLVENYTELDAADLDTDAIDAMVNLEISGSLLYGRAVLDRTNVLDLLDEIARSSYSWYGFTEEGVLTVGRFDLSNLASAAQVADIGSGEIFGEVSCENLAIRQGKVLLDARRNVVVQAEGLADSVSAEDKSKYSQQFQTRVSTTDPATATYLANWWDYHKTAIDSRPVETVLDSGGQTACDAITALFKPWTRVLRFSVGLDRYSLNPGDCVRFTYPRYGFDDGVNCRVAGVKASLVEGRVELTLVTQITPDYTTAAYP